MQVKRLLNQGWENVRGSVQVARRNVPMAHTPEVNDDEVWLDLPLSAREPMTAREAKAARNAIQALDTRTPVQRMMGEPPHWRSALAQRGLTD
jgi:hypothetical protein